MPTLGERVTAAYKAFREPSLITSPEPTAEWGDLAERRLRYAIYWAFFENTAYRSVHSWSHSYKVNQGLYRYIRNIYNPAQRLGTFWQTYLLGGMLDPEAGDGTGEPSAIPIVTDNEELRPAIAALWQDSNWKTNKDIWTLQGAVFGDAALEVVDDTERRKVYLRVVNPSVLKATTMDPFGNVKSYEFEESRANPERPSQSATYTETAERGPGESVVYRTYLNGNPYQWPRSPGAEWVESYGFVPLVAVQHNNVGLEWGWSEMHPGRGKFQECDDLASKLSDQIRKMVDSPWLFAGVDRPRTTQKTTSRDSETYQETATDVVNRPYPGREEIPALYGPVEAKAYPLVAPLDIGATVEYINTLLKELERDYPELQMDIWSTTGDASGRALRVARQRSEAKVLARRVAYEDALVRAQMMGVAIGGFRGYEGYEGFGLDSYERGDLDHSIGKRPVFAQDPLDDIEISREFWISAREAVNAGVPLRLYLKREGWNEEQLAELDQELEANTLRGVEKAPPWNIGEEPVEDEDEEED